MQKLCDYLTVGQAAKYLGVSAWTLRYWDRTGKLKPGRHPLSRYRLYRRDQLAAVLELAAGGSVPHGASGGPAGARARAGRPPRAKATSEA
jgi:excisionase family DNA binding protein